MLGVDPWLVVFVLVYIVWLAGHAGYRLGAHVGRRTTQRERTVTVQSPNDTSITLHIRTIERMLDTHGLIIQPKGVERAREHHG